MIGIIIILVLYILSLLYVWLPITVKVFEKVDTYFVSVPSYIFGFVLGLVWAIRDRDNFMASITTNKKDFTQKMLDRYFQGNHVVLMYWNCHVSIIMYLALYIKIWKH